MMWLPLVTETDPPAAVRPVPRTAVFIGWLRSLGIDWRIDAVLAHAQASVGGSEFVPSVVVQPLLRLPLDVQHIRARYRAWEETVVGSRRIVASARDAPVPALAEVLLRPLTGPTRVCDPVAATDDYWSQTQRLIDQAEELKRRVPGAESGESLLRDYPFVIAAMNYPKRQWDRLDPLRKPTSVDSVDRITDLRAPRLGQPTHHLVPHLAAEILRGLPDGRSTRSTGRNAAAQTLGPLKPRWAIKVALDLDSILPLQPEVRTLREWVDTAANGAADNEVRVERAAAKLPKYLENREWQVAHGRRVSTGTYMPRLIEPFILPDIGVMLQPQLHGLVSTDLALQNELLLEWIRDDRFERMMEIVSGKRIDVITTRASDGTLEALLAERFLELQRLRMRFSPSNPSYRGALAMDTRAIAGEEVDVEMTGFGSTDDVFQSWLGAARGLWAPRLEVD